MAIWDPALYNSFLEQRTQPARDLARRLAGSSVRTADSSRTENLVVLDVGCGPGNSTAVLAEVFPGAKLTGLDSSPEMIQESRKSGLQADWVIADGAFWTPPQAYDIVFSNAAFQWIPDQAGALRKAWSWLAPGGSLAVQVPGNGASGLHRALLAAAADPRWKKRSPDGFAGLEAVIHYHEPDFYYETLAPLGGKVDVWETTYWQVMENRQALISWYSGTGMRPWLEALGTEADRLDFKADVLARAAADYPERADGSVFFPFRRVFFIASKTKDDRGGLQ
jgi:trans-aconitate 2-methyltransferase